MMLFNGVSKVTSFNLLCLTIWNEYMSSLDVNTTRFECCLLTNLLENYCADV